MFTLEFGNSVVVFSVSHFPAWCHMGLIILRKHKRVKVWVFVFEVLTGIFVRQMSFIY